MKNKKHGTGLSDIRQKHHLLEDPFQGCITSFQNTETSDEYALQHI